jgi:hypothetical protein
MPQFLLFLQCLERATCTGVLLMCSPLQLVHVSTLRFDVLPCPAASPLSVPERATLLPNKYSRFNYALASPIRRFLHLPFEPVSSLRSILTSPY